MSKEEGRCSRLQAPGPCPPAPPLGGALLELGCRRAVVAERPGAPRGAGNPSKNSTASFFGKHTLGAGEWRARLDGG